MLSLDPGHSPGSTLPGREDYIQPLLKLGFPGTGTHFPTLRNYRAHESKQIPLGWGNREKNGFGKTENKLCTNSFRHLHTHINPQASLNAWTLLGRGSLDLRVCFIG